MSTLPKLRTTQNEVYHRQRSPVSGLIQHVKILSLQVAQDGCQYDQWHPDEHHCEIGRTLDANLEKKEERKRERIEGTG